MTHDICDWLTESLRPWQVILVSLTGLQQNIYSQVYINSIPKYLAIILPRFIDSLNNTYVMGFMAEVKKVEDLVKDYRVE